MRSSVAIHHAILGFARLLVMLLVGIFSWEGVGGVGYLVSYFMLYSRFDIQDYKLLQLLVFPFSFAISACTKLLNVFYFEFVMISIRISLWH